MTSTLYPLSHCVLYTVYSIHYVLYNLEGRNLVYGPYTKLEDLNDHLDQIDQLEICESTMCV